jgi:small-conductance mechanosensitive channel
MNEFAQLLLDLLADLTRFGVLRQFAALGVAFGLWLILKRQLKLEQRRWLGERRWPFLKRLKPLGNAALLWLFFALAATSLVSATGVGDLARFVVRFYALCMLTRVGLIVLQLYLPTKVVEREDLQLVRPLLVVIGVLLLYSQFDNLDALFAVEVIAIGRDGLSVGALALLVLGTYFVIVGSALPALALAALMRRVFKFSLPAYRASALLIRYLLVAIGLLLILVNVGVNTALIAAVGGGLSVGLGFGLKEVFSNFISGLWLLMEGAVRPGDVLLIESVNNGEDPCEVLELGMRATTLWRDRDNVELVVPNSTFFTQSMVTYSGVRDRHRRGQVLIGVAYRHPPKIVIALLEATARAVPRVLASPAPKGLLLRYDDSAITYGIRYWIENPMDGIGVASEVGIAVWEAFVREGIEIPYPQRVLHQARSD